MTASQRVLVTGAGGFIGGRVVESLWQLPEWEPRAGLRVWSNGARVGRMPVDMTVCDVLDPRQVRSAMSGVDAVVHCAVGSGPVIVQGTRNLLEAALEAGVERFVHLSTVDVYGQPTGTVSENSPFEKTEKEYGNHKIEAERLCRSFGDRGLGTTVLRPTIVYGPFCEEWVIDFVRRFRAGRRPVPRENADGTCNLLYVDDLVAAIRAALVEEEAVGKVYNISGPERDLTWNDYFSALRRATGLPEVQEKPASRSRAKSLLMQPVRSAAKTVLNRWEEPVMAVYKRYRPVRTLMKKMESAVRSTPTLNEYRLYSRDVTYEIDKARRQLDYRPRFTMSDGVELTARWLAHHGYVPSA